MKISGRSKGNEAKSDIGRIVAETARLVKALPDIRVEKVAPIQSALESGTYQVQGEKVADKVVSEALRDIRNRTR